MSSEVPVPRTAVPLGITDPVEKARAELKATLAAIEVKANFPRRLAHLATRVRRDAREFSGRNPTAATAIVVAGASAVGALVWALVRSYTR
jgi:hypothetical protein